MKIFTRVKDLSAELDACRAKGGAIGLVPTMGYLHAGHMSLVHEAMEHNSTVVVSVFVNPTQFGPNEDFDVYPRDPERDKAMLEHVGVNYLFMPDRDEMYPKGFAATVHLPGITESFCGARRPGHFDGVCTVVAKLFNIVRPDNAYFGLKDYQQYLVVKQMVRDLNFLVNIVGVPIVRELDGLALSSRNVYLTEKEREAALALSESFALVEGMLARGVTSAKKVIAEVRKFIEKEPELEIDYAEFAAPDTLEAVESLDRPFMLMLAVKMSKVRLLDNRLFKPVGKADTDAPAL